jgi:hypothetical protein
MAQVMRLSSHACSAPEEGVSQSPQLADKNEAGDPPPNRPLPRIAPMIYPTGGSVPQSGKSEPGACVTWSGTHRRR